MTNKKFHYDNKQMNYIYIINEKFYYDKKTIKRTEFTFSQTHNKRESF